MFNIVLYTANLLFSQKTKQTWFWVWFVAWWKFLQISVVFILQLSPAAQQMQPTQTLQSPPPSGGRRRRVVDEDPDERRRKFLERNRAAATRCRQKRKVWVMSLEKKAEELTQTNMQLQVLAGFSLTCSSGFQCWYNLCPAFHSSSNNRDSMELLLYSGRKQDGQCLLMYWWGWG